MKFLFLLGLLGATWLVSSFNPEDYFTCPTPCEDNPCDCDDAGPCVSGTCNAASGCAQCESGYWKKDYNYTCVGCTETFGDNCLHCTDFLGCQQCVNGSSRYYDDDCGLYYCITDGSTYNGSVFDGDCPLECSSDPCTCAEGQNCLEGTCHVNGCDQCIDGYFKKNYSYHCVDCQEYAGDNCDHCTDFLVCFLFLSLFSVFHFCQTAHAIFPSFVLVFVCRVFCSFVFVNRLILFLFDVFVRFVFESARGGYLFKKKKKKKKKKKMGESFCLQSTVV